jgi:hypothetical protein
VKGNICCKVNIALALSGVANDEEPMYSTVCSHASVKKYEQGIQKMYEHCRWSMGM